MNTSNKRTLITVFLAVLLLVSNGCDSPTESLEDRIEPVFGLPGPMSYTEIAVSRNESKIFFTAWDHDDADGLGGLGVYDTTAGDVTWLLDRHEKPLKFFLSPDDNQILCFNYHYDDSFIIPADGGEPVVIELDYGALVHSWLYGTTVLMTEQESPYGPGFSGEGDFYAFTYDFATGEREDILYLPDDSPDCWNFDVSFTADDDLTTAIVGISYTFDWEHRGEMRMYDLITGYYLIITLPYGASGAGAFSPDGSKIMSGDWISMFKKNIGYIDVERWEYVKVTDSWRYDHSPYWARNGDRIYFVGDDRVFRVNIE